jgi:hypothetical protein
MNDKNYLNRIRYNFRAYKFNQSLFQIILIFQAKRIIIKNFQHPFQFLPFDLIQQFFGEPLN